MLPQFNGEDRRQPSTLDQITKVGVPTGIGGLIIMMIYLLSTSADALHNHVQDPNLHYGIRAELADTFVRDKDLDRELIVINTKLDYISAKVEKLEDSG